VSQDASFHDHFSGVSSAYAAFRPRYPAELFARLAELAPARKSAWDAGTGSGQAARGLAEHFETVWATDASAAQLAQAPAHPRVHYRVAPAQASGLPDGSVDLVTVAQALHWFDRKRFYGEVRRVLRPAGVLAAWCYDLMHIGPEIDALVHTFYTETVGPYWPPQRRLVEARYRTLEFPFDRIEIPPVIMDAELDLDELAGYMRTWSAVTRYREAKGVDPVPRIIESLKSFWGPSETRRRVEWPLTILAGRI
jgi:SAM-dependent methyltransferase